eukprot:CAMPEP_0172499190 /NCGR_PEP_ID=MMETSP1066-20121228/123668_1 /TAXON_ID=671091 /ORGANISM="Coscinodiscus wailesii, Strain CCMP2513" /LENGTH=716 /DNA_ID=CAMNT_0013272801 /DNA_START=353 /DNA_END=2503 /DNA_ORIENTATION=-
MQQQYHHRWQGVAVNTPWGGGGRRNILLHATKISTNDSSSSSTTTGSGGGTNDDILPSSCLVGIEFVSDAVVQVLNSSFDAKDVARAKALSQLEKGSKKKKKKKKKSDDGGVGDDANAPPALSEEEKQRIGDEAAAAASAFTGLDAMVTRATKGEFGDYQCNAAMGLARNVGMAPRDCAAKLVEGLTPLIGTVMEELEIAGPGFINLRFKKEYLAKAVRSMALDPGRLAIPPSSTPQKIVIDYSSPNIAKEMHVGHLRSTIIGDTLANVLTFAGHDVKRLNHVGDWGTQFGMLVEHLRDEYPIALQKENAADVDLGDLVALYKRAKRRFDEEEDFRARAREGVVKLQSGERESVAAWEALCATSRKEYELIYGLLGIEGLEERGESFYNPYLEGVIEALAEEGLAVESDGAQAVFLPGYTNRDGSPLPLIVKKSDGGYNYATTDLAAIRQRTSLQEGELAERVLYVTDAGQAQHFQMVFRAAEMARFVPEGVSLEHVPFGLVQGEDGKKFATRSGDTVKLKDLLDEAVKIAGEDIRNRDDSKVKDSKFEKEVENVIRTVGIGAVKYADLSMNRESNYRFSYDRMLSLNGNTAPYMLYAYARICGIVRKATGQEDETVWPDPASEIILQEESEVNLARNLIKLPDILQDVEADLYPNKICDYLFETSQKFNQFYENCAVNNAETPQLKASRLTLCTVTAATIRLLLGMLGIQVVERL